MSQVPVRYPQVALPERWTATPSLYSTGSGRIYAGLNYANYRTGVAYTYLHTMIDPRVNPRRTNRVAGRIHAG